MDKFQKDREKFISSIKKDGVYSFEGCKMVVVKTPISAETQKLCDVLRRAAIIREESYDHEAANEAEKKSAYVDFSRYYRKDLKEASYEAVVEARLDPNIWYLVYIALETGWNDILAWAESPQ